jgi:hypothetical protein
MDAVPPGFWFGSSGGGAITAGEKGCASLDSALADKDAPNGCLAGGQKQNIENDCLNSFYFAETTIQVYAHFDPTHKYVIESGILESSAGDNPVVVYLGVGEVYDLDHEPEKNSKISEELNDLHLGSHVATILIPFEHNSDGLRTRHWKPTPHFSKESSPPVKYCTKFKHFSIVFF